MKPKSSSETNSKFDRTSLTSMSKVELELCVIDAIREHRRLLESDQIIYEEWERARANPQVPTEQIERLAAECLSRQERTAAQQNHLSELLDLLGYIPKVPEDGAEEVNRVQEYPCLSQARLRD
ncbi:transcriptional repressor TraM [Phyllobacterium ifriqiyense]|uniref:transcriptional repressor TraM n=1 Tax=Phyllobacterium ifriqiyense TaxID=314238 RepID=UPI003390A858